MVELQLPKLLTRVRFPSLAPLENGDARSQPLCGGIAQLVERMLRMHKVAGSTPVSSTNLFSKTSAQPLYAQALKHLLLWDPGFAFPCPLWRTSMRPFLQSLVVRLVVKLFRKNFTTPGIASSRALGVTLPPSGFANLAPPRRPRPVAAELAAWRLRNSSFPASSNSTRIRRPHADIRIAPNASRPLDLQNSGGRDPSFKKKKRVSPKTCGMSVLRLPFGHTSQ